MAYADLEIGLHRWDAANYSVELRYNQPDSDADVRLVQRGPALVQLDESGLRSHALAPEAYGKQLAEHLFADPALRTAFAQARSNADAADVPLRVRLFIDPSAPELHSLWWETLRDPQDESPLFTRERLLFSRYLSSMDWRPVRLRPRGDLRALVAIANPSNLAAYQLASLDVHGELARAEASLGSIQNTVLASGGSATLDRILDELRTGYDILYLVCHGGLIRGEPWLWLEDAAGNVAHVASGEFVTRLAELQQRPALVVLASCQSAGRGDAATSSDRGALAAVGPRLAESGIPAVLAMQGNITMQTIAGFMPVFFAELRRDGQIDRAVAVARGAVRERPDAWMPVLFMRLKSGRIWYIPGFATGGEGFRKWPSLLTRIQKGHCTPILGPGMSESLIGSSREIARRWAEQYSFPMAPYNRDDLPQVAQFLAVDQDPPFPRESLVRDLNEVLLARYGSQIPAEVDRTAVDQLVAAVGRQRRAHDPAEPHRVLASFPFPIYLTANVDNLLAGALEEEGRYPEVMICPWNKALERAHSVYDDEPDYRPTAQRPLIYHLFGQIGVPDSVVLTEDDYFNYLIGVTSNKDLIPEVVRRALADTPLLFLGFQMEDWNFRVLFRSLMGQEGNMRLKKYAHAAVQIDPEEGRILEPERARRYLEGYFGGSSISIYWGTTEDFVKELLPRVPPDHVGAAQPVTGVTRP